MQTWSSSSVTNEACADDGNGDGDTGALAVCDDVTVESKAQPSISTTDQLIPKDHIVLSGLTADATGTLWVELVVNEECGDAATPPYSTSFLVTARPPNSFAT